MASRRDPRTPALIILLMCATLTIMAGATIAPSLPAMGDHFSDNPAAFALVPLVLTVPGLAIAIAAPLSGLVADRLPKRSILILSMLVYVAAGSSGLVLDDITSIIAGRVLLGIAVGGIMTTSVALIAELYQDHERGRVLGYQSAAMAFGGVAFILTGGFLADLSWRAPFAVYLAPLLLLPLVLARIDRGNSVDLEPSEAHENRTRRFPWRHAIVIYPSVFIAFVVFYALPIKLPFLFRELGAERASTAGMAIALVTLVSGLASWHFQRIRGSISFPAMAAASLAIMAPAFAFMATLPSVALIFTVLPTVGLGMGLVMPNATTWLYSGVPAGVRGQAAGLMTMSVFTAQFLSAPVAAFFTAYGGISALFWFCSAIATLAGLAYAALAMLRRADAHKRV
ncbi:MFS transporter [Oricola sp.]|uniref:MFS transporter n=1 Tax=Oricola sp. TaxID=1979950 RepID=UPI003BAB91A8